MHKHTTLLLTIVSLLLLCSPGASQLRVRPVADQSGRIELALLLRKLQAGPTFMMTAAHPDDEDNALLAQLGWGEGLRTTLVTATRGQGGQNEIGPELFDALAVLRTEELLAAHRFDGAEQFFTRAIDFGYSFSIEENLEQWGKDEILGDFVRHIRTIRPDVIAGFVWSGEGGGQAHQASARLTAEAFRAAADPKRYPEQITAGLRPWQAKKFYYTAGFGRGPDLPQDLLIADTETYDPLLGRTYTEIGSEARSMHKCQGMSQLLALPGGAGRAYKLHDSVMPATARERSVMDGVPIGLTEYLVGFAPGTAALRGRVDAIVAHVRRASGALTTGGQSTAVEPLAQGLTAVRALRSELASLVIDETARYEIDFRLAQKEAIFQQALSTAAAVHVEALADDGLVVSGQVVKVDLLAANLGAEPVTVSSVSLDGFDGTASCSPRAVASSSVFECASQVRVPASAEPTGIYFERLPDVARYEFDEDVPFGAPFAPTPYRARVALQIGDAEVVLSRPVQFRYQTDVFAGEKRTELLVVPAMAVRVTPDVLIVPTTAASRGVGGSSDAIGREVRVTVTNHTRTAAQGRVRLNLPAGWSSEPAAAPVSFTREDEAATVRFSVRPPADLQPGRLPITAILESGSTRFDRGYQVIEYPHTRRRHVSEPGRTMATGIDVAVPQGLAVGYVVGVGDEVPQALTQLGLQVEFIDGDALAWGDLSKYDVIMTGVRAYERRADLRANNQRLIDYARQGGVVIVNYNKFEFNEAQYGPYPARVGRGRVTDEAAPVRVLAPEHPIFTTPNRIGADAWQNWVQERGLYFLDSQNLAPEYTDLVELEDPFPHNPGAQRGALVEAEVGDGRWIYLGLGLWRQLPAGTPGAYKLLANLVALGAH